MSFSRAVSSFSSGNVLAVFVLFVIALLGSAVAVAQSATTSDSTPEYPRLLMKTTMGDITLELDPERAPQTVSNFMAYVDDNFYTDTVFHRVIEGFMIQGGGFTSQYRRKVTRQPVSNEAYNGLRNQRYTIAMARTTAPHSATSQFFINTEHNNNLDHTGTTQRGWGYTVFGRVVEGQEVVDAISTVRTGAGGQFSRDVPVQPVVILGVEKILSNPAVPVESNNAPASPTTSTPSDAAAASPADPVIQNAESPVKKITTEVASPDGSVSDEVVNQN